MTPEQVEAVARAIANANGDEFANAFANKSRWIAKRGMSGGRFRDCNEPFQSDYLDMARAAIAAMPKPEASEVYRHVKRGTCYTVIGVAELQAKQLQGDHAALTIYRGEDGKLWARNSAEFHDGRFKLTALESAKP